MNCENCKHKGNNVEDRCRGCWKGGVWRRWEAAEEESPWIPVTEKLPVNVTRGYSDCVLTIKDDVIQIGRYDHVMAEWRTRDYQYLGHVSAWMPLPEPFKPKEVE